MAGNYKHRSGDAFSSMTMASLTAMCRRDLAMSLSGLAVLIWFSLKRRSVGITIERHYLQP
jgi:hypothetical protein